MLVTIACWLAVIMLAAWMLISLLLMMMAILYLDKALKSPSNIKELERKIKQSRGLE